jgi:hypothetical protein
MYCLCVNVYCHRVSTQLQLTNISIKILFTSGNDSGIITVGVIGIRTRDASVCESFTVAPFISLIFLSMFGALLNTNTVAKQRKRPSPQQGRNTSLVEYSQSMGASPTLPTSDLHSNEVLIAGSISLFLPRWAHTQTED